MIKNIQHDCKSLLHSKYSRTTVFEIFYLVSNPRQSPVYYPHASLHQFQNIVRLMHLHGRTFSEAMIARIRAAVTEPGMTCSALSRLVCGWLDWLGTDGRPQEVSCRKALVDLERRALITLPDAARLAHGALPAPGPHAPFSASK